MQEDNVQALNNWGLVICDLHPPPALTESSRPSLARETLSPPP